MLGSSLSLCSLTLDGLVVDLNGLLYCKALHSGEMQLRFYLGWRDV